MITFAKNMQMNQTYVIDSVYHIYVTILLSYRNHQEGKKTFLIIIEEETPDIAMYAKSLRDLKTFEDVICIRARAAVRVLRKHASRIEYIFKRSKTLASLFDIINPHIKDHHEYILNSEINMFHIIASKAYFLIKYPNNNFRMIEEGIGTYTKKARKFRRFKRKLMGFPELMGYDHQVSEILVQDPERMIDPILRSKSIMLDLNALLSNLSDNDKKNVLACFKLTELDIYSNNKKAIILTQPLINSGFDVTLEKMIAIYREMIKSAKSRGNEVYLKLHPREEINYEAIYKDDDIKIISKILPIEILNMDNSIYFDEAHTICSGAIDNLMHVGYRNNLGIDYLKKIK